MYPSAWAGPLSHATGTTREFIYGTDRPAAVPAHDILRRVIRQEPMR